MTAITTTMCSTAPAAGPRDNTDSQWNCAPWPQQASCHWPVHSSVSTGDMFVWCQFWSSKRVTRHAVCVHNLRQSSRELPLTRLFCCPAPFLISDQRVYWKNALFTHYLVLPLQWNVPGISGLFDPPLQPQELSLNRLRTRRWHPASLCFS